ncbi:MAG: hypothetical protein WB697_00100 [Stellaceae bacterium]
MWTLTPEYIQQVKEELKGRRAAIEARYADELKSIASDLDEIETLERIAYSFAVKHLSDPEPADAAIEPVVEVAALQPEPAAEEMKPEPEKMPGNDKAGLSRWRMRLDGKAEAESA